jgi:dTDP-4-dehydrorhamnose reductase
MKILVTGSNGLLGQKLLSTLSVKAHQLLGIDLADQSFVTSQVHEYRKLDITDRQSVARSIDEMQPDIILHTAAMTTVDKCELEKEICWRINVKGTDHLVNAALKAGSKFVFISSDYVFDGRNGPYKEDDRPNPISYYGRSKLAAENLIRGSSLNHAIVRTIVLYGLGQKVKSSFLTWLLEMLRAGKSVRIVNDQWGNSTIVDDLAAALERIVELGRNGIYHVGSKGYMTRYEFSVRAAEFFGLDKSLITPISTAELDQPAKRPLRSGLDTEKAERDLLLSFRTIEESFELYRQQELEMQQKGSL